MDRQEIKDPEAGMKKQEYSFEQDEMITAPDQGREQEIKEAEADASEDQWGLAIPGAILDVNLDQQANPDLVQPMDSNPKSGESLIEQDLVPNTRVEGIKVKVGDDMVEIPVPLGWKVVMRPKRAITETGWGFELGEKDKLQEAYATYVSQVLAIGEGCHKARDQGGVDMSKFKIKPQVGDWVIHTPYSGYRVRMRGMKEVDYLIVMDDTEIHCIINNPDDYFGVIDISTR